MADFLRDSRTLMSAETLSLAWSRLRRIGVESSVSESMASLVARLSNNEGSAADWRAAAETLLPTEPSLARSLLDEALQQWPRHADLHYLRGNAQRTSGNPRAAEEDLREALRLDPALVDASISLAYLLREQGRMQSMASVILAMWQKTGRTPDGDLRALTFLRDCGRHVDAASMLPTILADHAVPVRIHAIAGEIMLALGRFDQARAHLRVAVEGEPEHASAWLRLANAQRFNAADSGDFNRLEAAGARTDLSHETQVCIGFGLGKACDDLGDVERAASVLGVANARWRARQPWQRDRWLRFIDQRLGAPRTAACEVQSGVTPVFVLGLPRTGTTLVARLLAGDARVRNRGELNWIAAFAGRLATDNRPGLRDAAARMYLAQLRQDDAPAPCYVDKNPLNFLHLDLIAGLFPKARVVHCRRDPRDTALSLWSAHFMHADMGWSYDFGDIAAFAGGHARLMQHWASQALIPIHEVDYESLVADTDAEMQRLHAFIGLDGDAQPVAASETLTDAITTASVWQARQQIHARSVGRWQQYAPYLAPLAAFGESASTSLSRPA